MSAFVHGDGEVSGISIVADFLERQRPTKKRWSDEDFQNEGWLSKKFTSGNRCGHNYQNPRLNLRLPARTNIPPVLTKLQDKIKDYFDDPSLFPALNTVNKSDRKQRSERREALLLCLAVIVKFTNLLTLQCEIPSPQGMMGLTLKLLARHAGIGKSRIHRAISDLKKAGFIEVYERSILKEKGYRGAAAIKKLSIKIFVICELDEELERQTKRKQEQIEDAKKKAEKIEAKKLAEIAKKEFQELRQSTLFDGILGKLGIKKTQSRPVKRHSEHSDQIKRQLSVEKQHEFNQRCMALLQEHPDWSLDEIRRKAESEVLRS